MKKWRTFARWTVQTIGCVIAAATILTIIININADTVMGSVNLQSGFWPPLLTVFGVYTVLLSFIIVPISVNMICISNIPVCISVNMRRKDALVGMQMIKAISSVCCMLLGMITFWAAGWPLSDGKALPALKFLLCGLCMNLILTSVGNIAGAVYNIYQKSEIFIMSIIFFAVTAGGIGAAYSKTLRGGVGELLNFASFRIPAWVLLLAAAALLLDIIISKKYLYNMGIHS